jgi:cytochrome bd-type quinol oxidase subunit 2
MTGEHAIKAIILLFIVLPIVPIGISWRRLMTQSAVQVRATRLERAVLILVTLSQLLLMSALVSTDVLGHDYSDRRYATIAINFVAMLGATVAAAIAGRRVRSPLVFSAAWLTCSWAYVAMVNSAV